ncbi:hypothetical protein [Xenorhabdus cabanillasii]|uniref:Wzx n=1 Tax=Xenorhabdus cabanillasii JM26 TaxID=1427517 RepID=W1J3Q0_9GAMM|nr:hypothetical protein [Xenorhabdus cabanillasii]PHM77691.1 hypothetical protein Xcab_01721 [Xenorhabdus cabanillasii JM26]CDL84461.1 membrane hypothetical protein [Xenorhabdus cabanillasii JM26]
MIKKISSSIAIQSLGTISLLLTTLFITKEYGIQAQGEFAIIKSWVDLLVVIFCFGLPQSFIYGINVLRINSYKLKIFSIYYPFLVFPLVFLTTYLWLNNSSRLYYLFSSIFLSAGICFLIGYSLIRGIFLTINDNKLFSLITATPSILLFISVLILYKINFFSFHISYLSVGLLSFILILILVKKINIKSKDTIPWKILLKNGNNVLLQSISSGLIPVITYWLMNKYGMNNKDIGGFNLSAYSYQFFSLPFSMIAPIFVNQWSKQKDLNIIRSNIRKLLKVSLCILLVSTLTAIFLLPIIIEKILGNNLLFIIQSSRILLFSAAPLFINTVLAGLLISRGFFSYNMKSYTLKTIFVIVTLIFLFEFRLVSLQSVSFSWILGDLLLMFILYYKSVKIFRSKT